MKLVKTILCLVLPPLLGLAVLIPTNSAQAQDDIAPDIVGGTTTEPGEYPFLVALVGADEDNSYFGQFCGGSILNEQWILTAAHCVENSVAADTEVVTGRHNLRCFDNGGGTPACTEGQRIAIEEIYIHPEWDTVSFDNDVALLKLATATTADSIEMATPADAASYAPGVLATVIGWGFTESRPRFPEEPLQVDVPLLSDNSCQQPISNYSQDEIIDDSMICAGTTGIDSCSGDSGGPLFVSDGDGYLQVGIVSWGIGCADRAFPGVYSEVPSFESFIADTLAGNAPVAMCDGQVVTINLNTNGQDGTGTQGSDVILGTSGDDSISGLGGDDLICGDAGDDFIDGEAGDDTIFGGPGEDFVRGGNGEDFLWGGADDDRMYGGAGADVLNGEDGNDTLRGNRNKDILNGDDGNDVLIGGRGRDIVQGGDDDDDLFGGLDDDVLDGQAGTDSCDGGAGDGDRLGATCETQTNGD